MIEVDGLAGQYGRILMAARLARGGAAFMFAYAIFLAVVAAVIGVAADSPIPLQGWAILGVVLVFLATMSIVFTWIYTTLLAGSAQATAALLVAASIPFLGSMGASAWDIESSFSSDRPVGSILLVIVGDLLGVYFVFLFFQGCRAAFRARRGAYVVGLVDRGYGVRRRSDLYRAFGVPISPDDHRRALRGALVFALTAFLLEGFAFSAYFTVSLQLRSAGSASAGSDFLRSFPSFLKTNDGFTPIGGIVWLLVALLVGFGTLRGTLWIARKLRAKARRLALPTPQEALSFDHRPPVLFLRSFHDDQVSLASARLPWHLRLIDPGAEAHTLEELLILNFDHVGPLVAVGKPSDYLPPVGAARYYLGDNIWQDTVVELMQRSFVLVVGVSDTAGLGWEVDQILRRGHLSKTIFMLPPRLNDGRFAPSLLNRLVRGTLPPLGPDDRSAQGRRAHRPRHILGLTPNYWPGSLISSDRSTELDYEVALRFATPAAPLRTGLAVAPDYFAHSRRPATLARLVTMVVVVAMVAVSGTVLWRESQHLGSGAGTTSAFTQATNKYYTELQGDPIIAQILARAFAEHKDPNAELVALVNDGLRRVNPSVLATFDRSIEILLSDADDHSCAQYVLRIGSPDFTPALHMLKPAELADFYGTRFAAAVAAAHKAPLAAPLTSAETDEAAGYIAAAVGSAKLALLDPATTQPDSRICPIGRMVYAVPLNLSRPERDLTLRYLYQR